MHQVLQINNGRSYRPELKSGLRNALQHVRKARNGSMPIIN